MVAQVGKAITGHRFYVAADGCIELQYRVGGCYYPLSYLAKELHMWDAAHAYADKYIAEIKNNHTQVGQVVRRHHQGFGWLTGRVEYFDPDDDAMPYNVVYSSGEPTGYSAADLDKYKV